jgi:hypothetical protein
MEAQGIPQPPGRANSALSFPHVRITPFSGQVRDVPRFKHGLRTVFNSNPYYTELQKISLVTGLLAEDADSWVRAQGPTYTPTHWEQLIQDVVDGLDTGDKFVLQKELDQRNLRKGESLIRYRLELTDMFDILRTPVPDQVRHFVRGLPEAMATAVAARRPATVMSAYEAAFAIQRLVKKDMTGDAEEEPTQVTIPALIAPPSHTDKSPIVAGNSESIDMLTKSLEKLSLAFAARGSGRSNSGPSASFPQKGGNLPGSTNMASGSSLVRGVCGKCLQKGHYQRECPNAPAAAAQRCAVCKWYGHLEATCRVKQRQQTTQQSHLLSLIGQISQDELNQIIQENIDPREEMLDDGQNDGDYEILPTSYFFGLSVAEGSAPLPSCQLLEVVDPLDQPDEEDNTSESSFALTDSDSESEYEDAGEEIDDLPQSHVTDNIIGKAAKGRGRPPATRDVVEEGEQRRQQVNLRNQQERLAQGSDRTEKRKGKERRKKGTEQMEVDASEIAATKEARKEARRKQGHRLFETILTKDKMSLLSQTAPMLPYGRKQLHTFVDERILRYESKKKKQGDPASTHLGKKANSSATPRVSASTPAPTTLPQSHNIELLPPPAEESGQRVGRLCKIFVNIAGMQVPAIVDSGSEFSVISYDLVKAMGLEEYIDRKNPLQFTASDHGVHSAKGKITLIIQTGRMRCKLPLVVTGGKAPSTYFMLLGQDLLYPTKATINGEEGHVRFKLLDGTYAYVPVILENNPKPTRIASKN